MPTNNSLKDTRPKLYNKIIKLIESEKLGIEDIGKDSSVLKLNNNKPVGYGTVKRIILDEKGQKTLDKIQSIKKYFKGGIRQEAEKNIKKIMDDYYDRSMGTRALTKKYFPDSPEAKKGTSSTVLETVIKENKDPKRTRLDIKGTGSKGYSPAKIILNNPEAKAEFIKFSNTPGNTILNSMEEAGKIAKKYAPKGITKISPYTSRTGFMDSGLRKLIKQNVQLGKQTVDPEVTKRLEKVAKAIDETALPKGKIDSTNPVIKILAKKTGLTPTSFLNSISRIKENRKRINLSNKVSKNLGRFPDPGFVREILKMQGYSKSTINTVSAVEKAASSITEAGSQLEHALPKSMVKEFKLPRKYLLTAERTSNFLNQFKKQFDQQLLTAAKAHASGDLSYKDYKRKVEAISKIVSDKTGGYKIGYVDFVDGVPVAVTPQESLLKGEGDLGRKTKGLKNYFKNAVYHNKLFDSYQRNPNDPAFGTLRKEIQQGKYKFVKEIEAEKTARAIQNFDRPEQFFNFYKKDPENIFFKALTKAGGMVGGKGKLILGGAATLPLLTTALAAEEPDRAERKFNDVKYNPDIGAFAQEKDIDGVVAPTKVDQSSLLDWIADNPGTTVTAAGAASLTAKPVRKGVSTVARGLLRGIGTPLGVGALSLGLAPEEGYDLSDPMTRIGFEAEAAFAKPLVQGSQQIAKSFKNPVARRGIQTAFNLGLPAKIALRAARIATPLGIASLAGEGAYYGGKAILNEYNRRKNLSDEERAAEDAEMEFDLVGSA